MQLKLKNQLLNLKYHSRKKSYVFSSTASGIDNNVSNEKIPNMKFHHEIVISCFCFYWQSHCWKLLSILQIYPWRRPFSYMNNGSLLIASVWIAHKRLVTRWHKREWKSTNKHIDSQYIGFQMRPWFFFKSKLLLLADIIEDLR